MNAAESTGFTMFEAEVTRHETKRREMMDRIPSRYSGRASGARSWPTLPSTNGTKTGDVTFISRRLPLADHL
jgi:hypothetical protein